MINTTLKSSFSPLQNLWLDIRLLAALAILALRSKTPQDDLKAVSPPTDAQNAGNHGAASSTCQNFGRSTSPFST